MLQPSCPSCGQPLDAEGGVCRNCATNLQTESAARRSSGAATAPPDIPGYTMERRLGEGGMGAVYLAEETTLRRRVAVKVISRRIADDDQARGRFLREARTLATIEHPHVVRVYAFGESQNGAYLVMEYVEGETLHERIARLGPLPLPDALRIARQIVDALDAAWEQKVIHRDIKPSNILLDRRGRVRVADFGLAKPLHIEGEAGLTLTGYMLGTPHYVSPEQAQGREIDHRSDIYSLGIMLYQMLTGSPPFEGTTPIAVVAKHLNEPLPSLRARRPDAPEELERLIRWMTAKAPEQRPESYAALGAAIDGLLGAKPLTPVPGRPAMEAAPQPVRWNPDLTSLPPALRLAVIAGAMTVVTAGLYALRVFLDEKRPAAQAAQARDDRFAVAVAPFYGPDDDSAKEGRVMAALIEKAVVQKLGGEARVIGIDETNVAVRDHAAAREVGTKLGANAVIWGEAFALRSETEIQPHVTVIAPAGEGTENESAAPRRAEGLIDLADTREGGTLRLQAEAPNQIELRKTSATGIGDLALTLAGIHLLQRTNRPDRALALFEQTERSAESLRYRARALIALDRNDDARRLLEESLAIEPGHAPAHALIGDLHAIAGRIPEAIESYRKAAAIGAPFTAARGIVFDDLLYTKESYRSRRYGNHDTYWLLAIEPSTNRVVARYALPGVASRFAIRDGALQVTCDALVYERNRRTSRPFVLTLRNGTFDRPLWPTPDLRLRIRSIKAGRIVAANFLETVEAIPTRNDAAPGRLALAANPDPDVPVTLPDLERSLRDAIARDATQPWYRFLLALLLREQKREAEAEAVFSGLLARADPHVPYYDYAWMASMLERTHEGRWADRLYAKVIAQRRNVPFMATATLIERLVNAPFVRQAARNGEIPRGHHVLEVARAVSGPTGEGDDFAAILWSRYFRRTGSDEAAERESQFARRIGGDPFNFLATALRTDYVFALLFAGAFSCTALFAALAIRGIGRVKRARDAGLVVFESVRSRFRRGTSAMRRPYGTIVRTLTVAAAAFAAGASIVWWRTGLPALTLLLLLPLVLLQAMRVPFAALVASITSAERRLAVAAVVFLIACAGVNAWMFARIGSLAAIPIGISDAIGSPRLVGELEERLERHGDDDVRYAAAVANHYAGNRERATQLYAEMPDDPRAQRNASALKNGALPPLPLSSGELASAFGIHLKHQIRFRGLGDADEMAPLHPMAFLTVLCTAMVILMLLVRHRDEMAFERPRKRPGPGRFAAMAIVPSLYELARGSILRGAVSLFSFLLILPTAIFAIKAKAIAAGVSVVGFMLVPDFRASLPLPFGGPRTFADDLTMRLALPIGSVSAATLALAAIAFVVLHGAALVRLVRDVRTPSIADAPTAVAPASPGA